MSKEKSSVWNPTMLLRWENRLRNINHVNKTKEVYSILQQLWIDVEGNEELRDIDIVDKKLK